MSKSNKSDQFFVTAVTVAANLKLIIREAKNISLGSMNAKSIVARSGNNARAIQPITDYMEMLASKIISQVNEVSQQSLGVTQISLAGFAEERARNQFDWAIQNGQEMTYISHIQPFATDSKNQVKDIHQTIRHHIKELQMTLDEIDNNLVATNVATSKFRLEVGINDTGYSEHFLALLENFEIAAHKIRSTIAESKKALNESARKYFK
ncbi:hypothetical protein [Curvivirga sp.]|uniref:hypothetical protein n=1 Tax=Curvivirga sp. TaxID=2856848 RepID=UPI003B597FCF